MTKTARVLVADGDGDLREATLKAFGEVHYPALGSRSAAETFRRLQAGGFSNLVMHSWLEDGRAMETFVARILARRGRGARRRVPEFHLLFHSADNSVQEARRKGLDVYQREPGVPPKVEGGRIARQVILKTDPFRLPFATYMALGPREQQHMRQRAEAVYGDVAREEAVKRRSAWVIVCGQDIVRRSRTGNDLPSEKVFRKLGEETGVFPYLFALPATIEAVSVGAQDKARPWRRTQSPSPGERYPYLEITIVGQTGKSLGRDADLDTGSPVIALCEDELVDAGVFSPTPFYAEKVDLNTTCGKVKGRPVPLALKIKDSAGRTRQKLMMCHLVAKREWARMVPKKYGKREALVGRNLIRYFPLRVILDGKGPHGRGGTWVYH